MFRLKFVLSAEPLIFGVCFMIRQCRQDVINRECRGYRQVKTRFRLFLVMAYLFTSTDFFSICFLFLVLFSIRF